MKLVAGLGNPGPKYERTRHNVGFQVVRELARRWRLAEPRFDRDFQALLWDVQRPVGRVLLLLPQTYMNLSGRSVATVQRYFKLPPSNLLVVCDDLDLPVGTIRARASGSSAGQKGLGDIMAHLATQEIARLRIGIGRVHRAATVEHVLTTFSTDERPLMEETLARAADAVECWLCEGIVTTMNRFNQKPEKAAPPRAKRDDPPPPPQGDVT